MQSGTTDVALSESRSLADSRARVSLPLLCPGLVPYGDWIIGWAGGVLKDENDFYDVVEGHVDQPLRLYVYSYDFECVPSFSSPYPAPLAAAANPERSFSPRAC